MCCPLCSSDDELLLDVPQHKAQFLSEYCGLVLRQSHPTKDQRITPYIADIYMAAR